MDDKSRHEHVVPREDGWAVVTAGGSYIDKAFKRKGAAMAYAYDIATKNDVCMLVHDSEEKFKSLECPDDGTPKILTLVRMKTKI
ncbi:MAG: DUF2188 domain-containing protein [DPANN group archaeon]|nr:DUF2188 domain-containing protein [DPANN group archaeon]